MRKGQLKKSKWRLTVRQIFNFIKPEQKFQKCVFAERKCKEWETQWMSVIRLMNGFVTDHYTLKNKTPFQTLKCFLETSLVASMEGCLMLLLFPGGKWVMKSLTDRASIGRTALYSTLFLLFVQKDRNVKMHMKFPGCATQPVSDQAIFPRRRPLLSLAWLRSWYLMMVLLFVFLQTQSRSL